MTGGCCECSVCRAFHCPVTAVIWSVYVACFIKLSELVIRWTGAVSICQWQRSICHQRSPRGVIPPYLSNCPVGHYLTRSPYVLLDDHQRFISGLNPIRR